MKIDMVKVETVTIVTPIILSNCFNANFSLSFRTLYKPLFY